MFARLYIDVGKYWAISPPHKPCNSIVFYCLKERIVRIRRSALVLGQKMSSYDKFRPNGKSSVGCILEQGTHIENNLVVKRDAFPLEVVEYLETNKARDLRPVLCSSGCQQGKPKDCRYSAGLPFVGAAPLGS